MLPSLVPPGTPFTFNVTTAGGSVATYTVTSNAFTTERISITSPTGHTLADARLGQPLSIAWTLPTTFAIESIELEGLAFTGINTTDPATFKCSTEAENLGTTATATQITIPTTCVGLPVLRVILSLLVKGRNGERSQVFHYF